jgi:phosphopantetheinyl transferase (holo-ACP synthase)
MLAMGITFLYFLSDRSTDMRALRGQEDLTVLRRIKCIFLDVSSEVENDPKGIREALERVLDSSCCDARSWLSSGAHADDSVSAATKHDILKFVKIQDQYLAFASTLLKSRAFYDTMSSELNPENARLVVSLPRTEHRKPFIPLANLISLLPLEKEENCHPLSISHQFPCVGMARLEKCRDDPGTNPSPLLVGLDIVVFEDFNPRMYESTREFINVFRDSFTALEWKLIQSVGENDDAQDFTLLREFYLRWAVKEAYTKALGVGLGFDFGSFETHLDGQVHSLWDWVSSSPETEPCILGTVTTSPGTQETSSERWRFLFKPLFDPKSKGGSRPLDNMLGCACICVGPLITDENGAMEFQIETSSLEELILWHGPVLS